MEEARMMVEVSTGEAVDKKTILEIKMERVEDESKLHNIREEYMSLNKILVCHKIPSNLVKKLKEINEELWDIEDQIRDKERRSEFDADFVALARSVYFTNDRRAEVKREINEETGSRFVEEKDYQDYQ